MKLRHPFLIKSAALLGSVAVKRLADTLDIRVDYGPAGFHPTDPRTARYIYAFWHETFLVMTVLRAPIHVLISRHADGEFIARAIQHLGFKTVRGSTSRGGAAALHELIRGCGRTHLGITPDGPRGPRRRAQAGAVYLASATGLPIVPVGVGYLNAWRAKSWDRFAVPLPFSGVRGVIGAPMSVPPGLDSRNLSGYLQKLQEQLDSVTAAAETWAGLRPASPAIEPTLPLAASA